MLYPPDAQYDRRTRKTNDMSCVLKISAPGASMLLTSDIEALSEQRLLAVHRGELSGDVLLVPHHGSRTSSTAEFVAAVGAATAIFPVGYRNRYHHPNGEVLARYRTSGAGILRSDADGALTVRLGSAGVALERERQLQRRYWHGR
jgi:competence protein ComEC